MPLLLELTNGDLNAPPIRTIFKNGDDLRQDMLTLQAIELIDEILKENKIDLCLAPYKVIGTGFEQGFLEFVSDSITIAEIQYNKSVWNTFSNK
jgi:phosphatidylinositol kinase/protein kinase (PI-3  family)